MMAPFPQPVLLAVVAVVVVAAMPLLAIGTHAQQQQPACAYFPQDLSDGVLGLPLPPTLREQLRTIVNATASAVKIDGGFTVSLVLRGEPLFEGGFGYANQEDKSIAPDPKQSIFRIGSVTKLLTALLVLRAYEDGNMNLDAPLSTYFNMISPLPPLLTNTYVSVRAVLSHMGGIPREAPCSEQGDCEYTTADILHQLQDTDPLWAPFLRPAYSNLGFDLLGQAAAGIHNKSYEDAVSDSVLVPLGMHSSGFNYSSAILARMANGSATANQCLDKLGWANPAGGAYSTAHDMSTLLSLLTAPVNTTVSTTTFSPTMGSTPPQSSFFRQPQATRNMWMSPQYVFPSGDAAFALPFEMTRNETLGAWYVGKSGSISSFSTQVLLLQGFDVGVAVMANDDEMSAEAIAESVAQAIFPLVVNTFRDMEAAINHPLPPQPQYPLHTLIGLYEGESVAAGGHVSATVDVEQSRLQVVISFQGNSFPSYLEFVGPSAVFQGGIRARLAVPAAVPLSCYFRALLGFDGELVDIGDNSMLFANMIVGVTLHRKQP